MWTRSSPSSQTTIASRCCGTVPTPGWRRHGTPASGSRPKTSFSSWMPTICSPRGPSRCASAISRRTGMTRSSPASMARSCSAPRKRPSQTSRGGGFRSHSPDETGWRLVARARSTFTRRSRGRRSSRTLGGFDETFINGAEDWDLWLRVLRHGYTFLPTTTVVGAYRQRRASMIRSHAAVHLARAPTICSIQPGSGRWSTRARWCPMHACRSGTLRRRCSVWSEALDGPASAPLRRSRSTTPSPTRSAPSFARKRRWALVGRSASLPFEEECCAGSGCRHISPISWTLTRRGSSTRPPRRSPTTSSRTAHNTRAPSAPGT